MSVAPDIMLSGEMELSHKRAVHLRVVSNDNARLIRQIFCAHYFGFVVKQIHKPSEYSVYYGCFFVFQSVHLPVLIIIVRRRKVFNILNAQVLLKFQRNRRSSQTEIAAVNKLIEYPGYVGD